MVKLMTSKSSPNSTSIIVTAYGGASPTQRTDYTKKWIDSYSGGDDVAWRSHVTNHVNATNTLHATKSFVDYREYVHTGLSEPFPGPDPYAPWHLKYGTTGFPNQYYTLPTVPITVVHRSAALGQAVGGFNKKLDDLRSGFSGLTFLGELRESLRMIKSRTKDLCQQVSKTKQRLRRHFKTNKIRRSAATAADLWLEYSFGWSPLINDIKGAVKNLQPEPKYRVIAASGEDSEGGTPVFQRVGYADGTLCLLCDIFQSDKTVSQAKCVAEVSTQLLGLRQDQYLFFRDSAETWGLCLRDFVPTAWELLPYSWLIDYFTNIGDIVAAPWIDRHAITWQYQVQRTTRVIAAQFRNLRNRSWGGLRMTSITATPGSIRCGTKLFDRTRTVTAIPPFYLQYPDAGSLRWANLLAVWIQKTLNR